VIVAQASSSRNSNVSRLAANGSDRPTHSRSKQSQVTHLQAKQSQAKQPSLPHLQSVSQKSRQLSRRGIIASSIALAMTIWHWQLVMTLGLSLSAATLTYLAHQNRLRHVNWQKVEAQAQKLWNPRNRSVSLAIAVGTITLLTASTSIGLWQESHQAWLAIAVTLEGLGVLALLGLVSWLLIRQPLRSKKEQHDGSQQATLMNAWLHDLADADPLKRLIAIGCLMDQIESAKVEPELEPEIKRSPSPPATPTYLADCFRLMLNRETEPLVCTALLDALRRLNALQQLDSLQKLNALQQMSPAIAPAPVFTAPVFTEPAVALSTPTSQPVPQVAPIDQTVHRTSHSDKTNPKNSHHPSSSPSPHHRT
jgi:hypothetical protein